MFKPISEKPHRIFPNGISKQYKFDNNYGASVVYTPGYCGYTHEEKLWELCVTKYFITDKNTLDYRLIEDTPIGEGPVHFLTDDQVEELLKQIEQFKPTDEYYQRRLKNSAKDLLIALENVVDKFMPLYNKLIFSKRNAIDIARLQLAKVKREAINVKEYTTLNQKDIECLINR